FLLRLFPGFELGPRLLRAFLRFAAGLAFDAGAFVGFAARLFLRLALGALFGLALREHLRLLLCLGFRLPPCPFLGFARGFRCRLLRLGVALRTLGRFALGALFGLALRLFLELAPRFLFRFAPRLFLGFLLGLRLGFLFRLRLGLLAPELRGL